MAHALSVGELATQRTPGQWSRLYLAVPEYHTIYTARLAALPTSFDMVAEISVDTESGTRADVLSDMTLYVGTTAGAYDLGLCRIRKAPIEGVFYIAETSEVVWQEDAYLTVVDDYSLWQRSLRIVSSEPFMDWDVDYADQHEDFDPVPMMGSHRVAKLSGESVNVQLGPAADTSAWVIGSTISSVAWSVTGGTLDDATAVNPIATFTAPGTYLVYCLFTAANGKTYTGVRYVIIWDDTHPLLGDFLLSNGRGNFDSGGYSFEITLLSGGDTASLRKRSLVILCSEDYADSLPVTMPGQIEGAENIICMGWISDVDVRSDSQTGEISFTVQSAEYWLKQIRDYPSGLQLKAGTAAAWTDMPAMTVDRALWHFLHWRSTATRVMDVQLTGDARMASRFKTTRATLWDRLVTVAKPTIFAAPHVDNLGRLFVFIEPQLVPEDERTAIPVVMTILGEDIEGEISWERREVNQVSMLFFSGISVDATGSASSFFSMSAGHSYTQHGDEENQDNYLVESQEKSNETCGLYYGWKNNPLDNLEIKFAHSLRVLGVCPRQYFHYELTAGQDPRGVGFDGNLIPRSIQFASNPETGFLSYSIVFEPESFEGPSINGDVPTMENVDFSIPDVSFDPFLPLTPYIPMPPTEEPTSEPSKIIIWSSYGVFYTENFDEDTPEWKSMNNGLSAEQKADIQNLVVTPSGTLYMLTRHAEVMAADAIGGSWREVLSYADFPIYTFDYRKVMGIGINPHASDQIGVYGGQVWLISPLHYGMMYMTVGNKNGFGSFNSMVEGHYFEATVQYQNGGWLVFHAGLSGILGGTPYPRIAQCNASGVYADIADNTNGWGPASQFAIPIGTTDKSMYWHDNGIHSQYVDLVGIDTQTVNLGIAPRNRQAIAMSPAGLCGMAASVSTPYKTTDGGATWVSAAGVIPIGPDVWENCGDDFRWIFGGGNVLRLTMDQGATYEEKIGNMLQLFPLIDIQGIRFIE